MLKPLVAFNDIVEEDVAWGASEVDIADEEYPGEELQIESTMVVGLFENRGDHGRILGYAHESMAASKRTLKLRLLLVAPPNPLGF